VTRRCNVLPALVNRTAENLWRKWEAALAVAGIGDPGHENAPAAAGVTDSGYSFGARLLTVNVSAKSKKMWTQLAHTLDEIAPGGQPNPPSEIVTWIVAAINDDYP